jgi:hypothetical protein
MAHTCNPSYLGGREQEDHGSRLVQENSSQDPVSKKNQNQLDWRCGSSDRVSALQAQSPKFNPSPITKNWSQGYIILL